ncbi:MAG: hypothetical protein GEV03_01210 [Streptosporangiales bacterium]|nr:hypothetical protein [Streptosporangiales bacterium]
MSAARPRNSGLVDLVAVHTSDRTIEALAARRAAPSDDVAVRLLAALAADVDVDADRRAGRPAIEAVPDEPVPIGSRRDRRSGRRIGIRTAITAGVAAAALTTTGVAAGTIGGLKSVERALGINAEIVSPGERVREALETARHQMDHGEYAAARETLRVAWGRWASLRGPEAAELADAIESLQARLAREAGIPPEQVAPKSYPDGRPAPPPAPTGVAGGGAVSPSGASNGNTGEGAVGAPDTDTGNGGNGSASRPKDKAKVAPDPQPTDADGGSGGSPSPQPTTTASPEPSTTSSQSTEATQEGLQNVEPTAQEQNADSDGPDDTATPDP